MDMGSVNPDQYQQLLQVKAEQVRQLFTAFGAPQVEVFESAASHYRLRAEFRIWHEEDDLFYAMFEPGNKRVPVRIDECPMVSERIHSVMFALLDEIRKQPVLSRKLFQVDFLSTLSGELLVTLLYHRPLEEEWRSVVEPLRAQFGIDIIGRSRKTKLVVERDYVIEKLQVGDRQFVYQQVENSFTQPNGGVAEKMLAWAQDVTQSQSGDLLELYCGNANFTIALAHKFRQVLATEISKTSVKSALYNLEANKVDNVEVVRLSSEEFTQAMNKEREFRRLNEKDIDLDSYEFSTVLVDPPRSGLDQGTEKLVQRFDRILYISCNPDTLKQNLQGLNQTHRIERLALFDQFPYTDHKECGVWLVRR
ncbi:MAG: tRNA (uridine(54)-C5)-methyltransferase TrmA [Motiliproteus sp.]|nr:tRNA (uridine(54)-C5)-methyltransferase TrmA [Motiliproteus sp.]MCW9053317.1 tRNA (uridine(54)-C5)-methyltransferase TrmA [Motiliproteus sp.]